MNIAKYKVKNITIMFLLLINYNLFSQNSSLFIDINTKTYKLYTEKNWKELIKISKKALENNIDYYYLRMRLGIAYYEQRKYNLAYKQFEKAKFFEHNDIVDEYLYYSYLFGGNYTEAEKLSSSFNNNLKSKLKISKNLFIKFVGCSYGILINNDYNKLTKIVPKQNNEYLYNNQFREQINSFFSFDLKLKIHKNFSSILSFGQFNEPKKQIIHYHKYLDDTVSTKIYANATTQSKFYFNLIYESLKLKWYLALNYIQLKDNYIKFDDDNKKEVSEKYENIVLSTGIETKQTYTSFGLNLSISNLGIQKQIQSGLLFKLFPKANQNFIIYYAPYFQYISEATSYEQGKFSKKYSSNNSLITKIGILTMPIKNLFLDIKVYFGKIYQFNDNSGYIIFNDVDPINFLYNSTLSYKFKKLELFVSYSYFEKQHEYFIINYYMINHNSINYKNINITNQSIIGGILWNF